MIKFRHKKIDDRVYKIYMVYMNKSCPWVSIVPIPGEKGFCYTYSKEIARKTCKLLESVTNNQDLKHWSRPTLKKVQQIARLTNRMAYHEHIYPIPFSDLERILGLEITTWTITESYKQMIATFKYKLKCETEGMYENEEKGKVKKYLLYLLLKWVEDPNKLANLIDKGIVEPNLTPNLLNLED
ncbi:MAG: hypothetical protein RID09_20405 [Coleofasciculus sp. G1-WW12-02]|uniref:hypothetical protein n=1 Tax=Coleofasciculus sp. G1-WW12-02 TaxID=3068483 RepID=UPI0032FA9BEC